MYERSAFFEKRLLSYLTGHPTVSPKRYLDVGSGRGEIFNTLSQNFAESVAVDIDKFSILVLKSRESISSSVVLVASALRLPLSNNTFDVVSAFSLIEHIKDKPRLIKEVWRVLKKDGAFVIQFPNKRFFLEAHSSIPFPSIVPWRVQEWWAKKILGWSDYPVYNLTMKEILGKMTPFFEDIRIQKINYPISAIPIKLTVFYKILKKLHFLEKFPMGYMMICRKKGAVGN
jgi:ubiquinone/menaquinone biosynthesis C-methylase UbiE